MFEPTVMYYDDLGRQVATIENQTGTAAIVWNQTLGRWEPVNASHEDTDENRAVSVVYTLTAHKVEQLAHRLDDMDEDEPQITTYLSSYDDRVSAQELFPGHGVVRMVVYPDTEVAPEDHSVAMAYNRLGQVRYTVDQNETEHAFTRDALGRVTADTATVAYGSNIDASIVKIAVSYDGFGRRPPINPLAAEHHPSTPHNNPPPHLGSSRPRPHAQPSHEPPPLRRANPTKPSTPHLPNTIPQISNLKSQISNLKSQISNLKSQISNPPPQPAPPFPRLRFRALPHATQTNAAPTSHLPEAPPLQRRSHARPPESTPPHTNISPPPPQTPRIPHRYAPSYPPPAPPAARWQPAAHHATQPAIPPCTIPPAARGLAAPACNVLMLSLPTKHRISAAPRTTTLHHPAPATTAPPPTTAIVSL